MDKWKMEKLGACAATGAALLIGCAVAPPSAESWVPPAAGSTWQMSQHNTGSYGKDAEAVATRSDGLWQGTRVVQIRNTVNGMTVNALPSGKWVAITDKDGKPLLTYDPPIGYEFPLAVGKTWKTHHKATNHQTGKANEFDYACVVESFESVQVRAGAFDAFKIVCDNEFNRDVSWYVPALGMHAKLDFTRKAAFPAGPGTQQSELVAVSLAK